MSARYKMLRFRHRFDLLALSHRLMSRFDAASATRQRSVAAMSLRR